MATLLEERTAEFDVPEADADLDMGSRLRTLTVGGAVAAAIALMAALLRLYDLGSRPFDGIEAERALLALQFVQGQPAELTGFSPLLANLNLLLFFVAGASDFWARLVPALFGIALVVLPVVRFRHRLGTGGALAASALLAISPTLVLFSRSAAPAMLTAVLVLVFVGALADFVARREEQDLLIAAGALALALAAGPGAYTVLLSLLVFGVGAWLLHRHRGAAGWGRIRAAFQRIRRDRDVLARLGATLGVTFIVAATGFLVNFGGIQAALNLFVEWLRSFTLTSEYPGWYYAGTLVLYEPIILLFGLLGTVIAVRRRGLFGLLLVTWFLVSLTLYTFLGATEPAALVLMVVPLALLAGWGVASIFEFAGTGEAIRGLVVAAFELPLLVFIVLQLVFYTNNPTQVINLFLALGAVLIAVVIAAVFALSQLGMGWQPATVARGVGVSLLLFTLAFTLHTGWHLNVVQHEPMRELLLTEPTSPDMHEMVSVLETLSQNRVGDTVSIPITVDGRLSPVVPWYLKDFTNVTVVDEVLQPPETPVVVMPATDEPPLIGSRYVGQSFRLSSRWRPNDLSGRDFARWYFYREGTAVPSSELILFVER